jgi:signal peptidase II
VASWSKSALSRLVIVGLIVIALDQLSKWLVLTYAAGSVHFNADAAFSLALPEWAIGLIFLGLVLVTLLFWKSWTVVERFRLALPLGLIAGGALSNIIDRLVRGAVVDFINLRVWPVFNLADTALVVGTILFLWYSWRYSTTSHGKRGPQRQSRDVA